MYPQDDGFVNTKQTKSCLMVQEKLPPWSGTPIGPVFIYSKTKSQTGCENNSVTHISSKIHAIRTWRKTGTDVVYVSWKKCLITYFFYIRENFLEIIIWCIKSISKCAILRQMCCIFLVKSCNFELEKENDYSGTNVISNTQCNHHHYNLHTFFSFHLYRHSICSTARYEMIYIVRVLNFLHKANFDCLT